MKTTKKPTTGKPRELKRGEVVTDPTREVIASSVEFSFFQGDRALPYSVDDAERDFGLTIYDRMLNDPVIAGTVDGLLIKVFEGGISIVPAIDGEMVSEPDPETSTPEEVADFKKAKENADLVRYCYQQVGISVRRPTVAIIREVTRAAFCKGHKLCEMKTPLAEDGPFKGKNILTAIKPKPRENYVFVLDEKNNFRGVIAKIPGVSIMQRQGLVWDASLLPNAVDPRKLFILTFGGENDNPQGFPTLRPAYDPWMRKQLLKPEEVKTGVNFGGGKITGTIGENASPTVDAHGVETQPTQHMANALANLASSGGVAAFEYGATVQVWYPESDGAFFDGAFGRADTEIVLAIAKQTRATMEAEHGSKADSETAENMQDSVVGWIREHTGASMDMQINRMVIELNDPDPESARRFTPKTMIGGVSKPDFASDIDSLSKAGYRLHRSQFAAIDKKYKMPERDEKAEAEDARAEAEAKSKGLQQDPKPAPKKS